MNAMPDTAMTQSPETLDRASQTALSLHRAMAFLFLEADLADEHRMDEWLALWETEDILYWIPAGADDVDPAQSISIAYDNRSRLEDRIFRLNSRTAHAQRPRSRMRRVVSNIVITGDDGYEAQVVANFILAEMRNGHQDIFNGRFVYTLTYNHDTIRIRKKTVLLINNDGFIDNLAFLL